MHEVVAVAIAVVGGWLIPWAAMRIIMHLRFKSGKQQTKNYAGNTVSYGLALVWPVWAITLGLLLLTGHRIVDFILSLHGTVIDNSFSLALIQGFQAYSFNNVFLTLAVPLVLFCFFFGWLDDRFGARGDGGFKGHIKSLLGGKLTTGMIKVLGIGVTSLVVAFLAFGHGFTRESFSRMDLFDIVWVVLGMCAIALSANLINLFDLRPARASKVYSFAYVDTFIVVVIISLLTASLVGILNPWQDITTHLVFLIWALGPVVAIWSFDARGRAMLGDAGANPMGALLGLYAAMGLWLLLPAYVIIVFVLNMLSEKVSFSAVIGRTPLLLKLDSLGRKHEGRKKKSPETDNLEGRSA